MTAFNYDSTNLLNLLIPDSSIISKNIPAAKIDIPNYAKDITQKLREGYESTIVVFNTYIPFSVKAAECSLEGVSIYIHEPKGKVAEAYKKLTEEVLSHEN